MVSSGSELKTHAWRIPICGKIQRKIIPPLNKKFYLLNSMEILYIVVYKPIHIALWVIRFSTIEPKIWNICSYP